MNGNDIVRAGRRFMQYVWDPPPRNEDDSPIWCLGERYDSHPIPTKTENQGGTASVASTSYSESSHSNADSKLSTTNDEDKTRDSAAVAEDESFEKIEAQDEGADNGWPTAFLDDVESKIWLTYRQDFAHIPTSTDPKATGGMSFGTRLKMLGNKGGFSSDTGWGCMIRSGQSLLANALVMIELGRDWRRGQDAQAEAKLLSLFADDPDAPFSIHRFVEHGASACGKHPGEWFGPSATARCIQALTTSPPTPSNLRVYVRPDDSDIYEDSFLRIAKSSDGTFHPTLILLGTRLGIDRVTPAYWASLASALSLPQSVGIAGGRPSSSHYFIGVQGSHYFYLDPHYTRPKLPLNPTEADVATCHTRRLRQLHVTQMDPSMLLGFLIRSEEEWKTWRRTVTAKPGPTSEGGRSSSIVHIHDTEPVYNPSGAEGERAGALDEVQSCDEGMESGEDGDTVVC
ncbi:putative autophagy cysteine endopeptidase Atg4 [Delphinella strobiligena]|nr:putative autophagy cysteine endopeptidase Atg4 [Delphinella strobiligena]